MSIWHASIFPFTLRQQRTANEPQSVSLARHNAPPLLDLELHIPRIVARTSRRCHLGALEAFASQSVGQLFPCRSWRTRRGPRYQSVRCKRSAFQTMIEEGLVCTSDSTSIPCCRRRGKPSSMRNRRVCEPSCTMARLRIFMSRSVGISVPFRIYGVSSARSRLCSSCDVARRMSPTERWQPLYSAASFLQSVPLPAPGQPV